MQLSRSMQIQTLAPLLAIASGALLRWFGGPSMEALAWVFVAGGLAGAVLGLFVARRPLPPTANRALPNAVLVTEPETWSQNVSVIAADALVDAGLVAPHALQRASEVIGEEIAVRLSVGDYPAQAAQAAQEPRPGA